MANDLKIPLTDDSVTKNKVTESAQPSTKGKHWSEVKFKNINEKKINDDDDEGGGGSGKKMTTFKNLDKMVDKGAFAKSQFSDFLEEALGADALDDPLATDEVDSDNQEKQAEKQSNEKSRTENFKDSKSNVKLSSLSSISSMATTQNAAGSINAGTKQSAAFLSASEKVQVNNDALTGKTAYGEKTNGHGVTKASGSLWTNIGNVIQNNATQTSQKASVATGNNTNSSPTQQSPGRKR